MDDQFLYQLREQPEPAFVKSLQNKLNAYPAAPKWQLNKRTKLAWAAALMLLIFAATAISPARAFVASLFASFAGQSFEMTENYPGDRNVDTIVEPQVMSLAEAISIFPHEIKLPSNVPAGFTLDEENVSVYTGANAGPFADTLVIQWKPSTGLYLTLYISNHDWGTIAEVTAPDAVEEIILDGEHSAVIIRGGWSADQKEWKDMGMLRLRWLVDDLAYDLHGNAANVSVEQLVQIALSTLK